MTPVQVSAEAFKQTFGAVPSPVAVVTTIRGAHPATCTVSAFCSLSLAPRKGIERFRGIDWHEDRCLPRLPGSVHYFTGRDPQLGPVTIARNGVLLTEQLDARWSLDNGIESPKFAPTTTPAPSPAVSCQASTTSAAAIRGA